MRKYEKPEATLTLFKNDDVCTTSGLDGGGESNGNLKLNGYDYEGKWF